MLHIFQAATNRTPFATLMSILHQIDNRPDWYTTKMFRRQIFKYMVDNADFLREELLEQLKLTKFTYIEICERVGNGKRMEDAVHFVVAVCSVMLQLPIVLVYPIQNKDNRSRLVTYSFKEVPACQTLAKPNWQEYPVKLVFNGVDQYVPFIQHSIANVTNMGNPALADLDNVYDKFCEIADITPANTKIRGGITEIIGFLKAAKKIGKKMNFTAGTSDFSNEPEAPTDVVLLDTSPIKSIKLRKRRRSISDDEAEESAKKKKADEEAGGEKEGQQQDEEQGEKGDIPGTKKPKVDCERKDKQCWCGKEFQSFKEMNRHIQIKHKTTWKCSGMMRVDGEEGVSKWVGCDEVCGKRNSLWSHYRRVHEGRYHHYCRIENCKFGSDEEWQVHLHRMKEHHIPLREEQKCPKCGHPFGQEGRYKRHVVTCQTSVRPFECSVCGKTFRQQDTYKRHMRQQHKKKGESKDSHWFFCQYCSKRLATRTGKKTHEALPHAADGSFIKKKKKKPAADTATDQQN